MNAKTELFLSLIWEDLTTFASGVWEVISLVFLPLVFVLCGASLISHGICVYSGDRGAPLIVVITSWAVLLAVTVWYLGSWLKRRWDSLPDSN